MPFFKDFLNLAVNYHTVAGVIYVDGPDNNVNLGQNPARDVQIGDKVDFINHLPWSHTPLGVALHIFHHNIVLPKFCRNCGKLTMHI